MSAWIGFVEHLCSKLKGNDPATKTVKLQATMMWTRDRNLLQGG